MRDPVTGFEYPVEWVKRCAVPAQILLAEQGLAVLTSSGTVLCRGFTTGTTAAAACKAALLSLSGTTISSVFIKIPSGLTGNYKRKIQNCYFNQAPEQGNKPDRS